MLVQAASVLVQPVDSPPRIYVFGGVAESNQYQQASRQLFVFDFANATWSSLSDGPDAIWAATGIYHPPTNTLHFIGGNRASNPSIMGFPVLRYSIDADEWSIGALQDPVRNRVAATAALVDDDVVVVVGGSHPGLGYGFPEQPCFWEDALVLDLGEPKRAGVGLKALVFIARLDAVLTRIRYIPITELSGTAKHRQGHSMFRRNTAAADTLVVTAGTNGFMLSDMLNLSVAAFTQWTTDVVRDRDVCRVENWCAMHVDCDECVSQPGCGWCNETCVVQAASGQYQYLEYVAADAAPTARCPIGSVAATTASQCPPREFDSSYECMTVEKGRLSQSTKKSRGPCLRQITPITNCTRTATNLRILTTQGFDLVFRVTSISPSDAPLFLTVLSALPAGSLAGTSPLFFNATDPRRASSRIVIRVSYPQSTDPVPTVKYSFLAEAIQNTTLLSSGNGNGGLSGTYNDGTESTLDVSTFAIVFIVSMVASVGITYSIRRVRDRVRRTILIRQGAIERVPAEPPRIFEVTMDDLRGGCGGMGTVGVSVGAVKGWEGGSSRGKGGKRGKAGKGDAVEMETLHERVLRSARMDRGEAGDDPEANAAWETRKKGGCVALMARKRIAGLSNGHGDGNCAEFNYLSTGNSNRKEHPIVTKALDAHLDTVNARSARPVLLLAKARAGRQRPSPTNFGNALRTRQTSNYPSTSLDDADPYVPDAPEPLNRSLAISSTATYPNRQSIERYKRGSHEVRRTRALESTTGDAPTRKSILASLFPRPALNFVQNGPGRTASSVQTATFNDIVYGVFIARAGLTFDAQALGPRALLRFLLLALPIATTHLQGIHHDTMLSKDDLAHTVYAGAQMSMLMGMGWVAPAAFTTWQNAWMPFLIFVIIARAAHAVAALLVAVCDRRPRAVGGLVWRAAAALVVVGGWTVALIMGNSRLDARDAAWGAAVGVDVFFAAMEGILGHNPRSGSRVGRLDGGEEGAMHHSRGELNRAQERMRARLRASSISILAVGAAQMFQTREGVGIPDNVVGVTFDARCILVGVASLCVLYGLERLYCGANPIQRKHHHPTARSNRMDSTSSSRSLLNMAPSRNPLACAETWLHIPLHVSFVVTVTCTRQTLAYLCAWLSGDYTFPLSPPPSPPSILPLGAPAVLGSAQAAAIANGTSAVTAYAASMIDGSGIAGGTSSLAPSAWSSWGVALVGAGCAITCTCGILGARWPAYTSPARSRAADGFGIAVRLALVAGLAATAVVDVGALWTMIGMAIALIVGSVLCEGARLVK
ncbi:hypothetical protein BDK51DRAFT_42147 [Blyttiomyces helicus]|uniref:PSI domain-containing protein n=1 Tax=Blyttiomyces helicus TaxID=388810 RepID=A0A4P9WFK7_9FUNG|nr:hypothetical protein BDK51DRAFT_42147 [Blyttiomyces helicus]|eukprot:RKO91414.1 hypothetical protein BDK51DRAFT_42147 [Blyttiomyces helicus]